MKETLSEESRLALVAYRMERAHDYDDFAYCDREMVDELYPQAEHFIQAVQRLIG